MPYLRNPQLTDASQCLVIVVDLQEKLTAAIPQAEKLLSRSRLLLKGAQVLGIPILATEQYPQGLGVTVASISEFIDSPAAKKRFSSVEVLELPAAGEREDGRFRVILTGIEAHVCILQTAYDLQSLGYEVLLPVDAIESQNQIDRDVAFTRMSNAGMALTTVESILLECCETADHPEFKRISRLITGRE
ncbi:isochorismatase family protein [Rubinisphaera sp.]|uniref:isochorismatase family protein n=1 Tax=Rubinisphaera sp. TaxID=2024857 RepID=UPI000C0E585D|nr:isochorismatase family protein [Rubinisphaera sp.]MBV11091.1 isochorismatase [Rubinisphaera sp.]HCS54915.1 isochorismatase [Planctomycetaceae bacterium]|tara:strand:- start:171 stop:740 length:570 start_codon:yes stop_codon:yes gene_type:complete